MRLIDADALMEKVCGNCQGNDCVPDATDTVYGCELAEIINQMPTIKPEVRHGEWEYRHADDWMFCTACGADAEGDCGEPLETLYCPNCGARMD